jgi:hypothetical protein
LGDRFYTQQLEALGRCPGFENTTKRRKKVAWTDEKRAQAIELYEKAEPTAENSMEIVKSIAEELEESPNGVRTILSKAGVYVKSTPAASTSKASTKSESSGGARVSKDAAHKALTDAITDAGAAVDEEIISKLTGKAALYLTEVIRKAAG